MLLRFNSGQLRAGAMAIFFIVVAAMFSLRPAIAQDVSHDEINPATLRQAWARKVLGQDLAPAAAPWTLTKVARDRFGGSFGVDLSHYTFDRNTTSSCNDPVKYTTKQCSCTANWSEFPKHGLLYVYTKASDGRGVDLSFARVWSQLEPLHRSKALFRGAYHFLRPGVDAETQAKTFLQAIGAVNGKKPAQLPPVLDIEWSNKTVTEAEWNNCEENSRLRIARANRQDRLVCDMWSKVASADIAAMAKKWIEVVERETGRPVIIYTNPLAWWNPMMKSDGHDLMKRQAVWTSRYTSDGPAFRPNWPGSNKKWKMPGLPSGASYPDDKYTTAHFWQFTDKGSVAATNKRGEKAKLFKCGETLVDKAMDMNWVPVGRDGYQHLFGVAEN